MNRKPVLSHQAVHPPSNNSAELPKKGYQSYRLSIAIGTTVTFLLLSAVPQLTGESLTGVNLASIHNNTSQVRKNVFSSHSGRAARLFSGQYRAMAPDGTGMTTYSVEEARSHLQSLDNREISEYEGEFQEFTPEKQGSLPTLMVSPGYTHLAVESLKHSQVHR